MNRTFLLRKEADISKVDGQRLTSSTFLQVGSFQAAYVSL